MPLSPFTPAGVTAKCATLYALPDYDLFAEADAVKADFRTWLTANFSLDTNQEQFLKDINDSAVKYYGDQCSICFRNRLSISLIYPVPTPGYSKWNVVENTIVMKANDTGIVEVSGSLTFTMEFRP
ncbi:hypothetical protein HDC92_003783 [Pedobacter sp. AK017]|uniref:hypothetical protein n=1 Tax=Pedobacter sp. AK017 TaxID=2723073 RepID=UPI0016229B5B|nr:hypothetical protein [Pedobacter sp. AK017]MBB5440085.1 hypothetical protein [Pedobacter sp. AK017]